MMANIGVFTRSELGRVPRLGFRLLQQSTRTILATSFRDSWRTLQSPLLMPSATLAGILAGSEYGPGSSGWGGGASGSLGAFFAVGAGSLLVGEAAGGIRDAAVLLDGDAATGAVLLSELATVGERGGEFFSVAC